MYLFYPSLRLSYFSEEILLFLLQSVGRNENVMLSKASILEYPRFEIKKFYTGVL